MRGAGSGSKRVGGVNKGGKRVVNRGDDKILEIGTLIVRGRTSGVEAPARITQLEHPRPCKEPHLPTSQDNFLPKIEEPHIGTNQGLHLTKKVNAMQR